MKHPDKGARPGSDRPLPSAIELADSTPLLPDHQPQFPAGWETRPGAALLQAPLPEKIGPYKVLERLGSGGMGEVFLVLDETLSRTIALKRVRPDRSAEELSRRFEVEARVTALLQHPSIIPVYDLVTAGPNSYYTMRPVEGRSLAQLLALLREDGLQRSEWPIARLVRLFLQAANAVAYAHSRGVIHRDLKPSNIMIGPFEEILVLDWGMARIQGEEHPMPSSVMPLDELRWIREETASQALMGTPAYMSPEQLEGSSADERSDVFSLGVILYELLTLGSPWRAATIGELREAIQEPPLDPALAAPGRGISNALGDVVRRALAPRPELRFRTVRAFANAVAHALEGRASWRPNEASASLDTWRIYQGRHRVEANAIVLHSRGAGRSFRYFCTERFGENVSIDVDVKIRGRCELSLWLNTGPARQQRPREGYRLGVLPGRRATLSIERSGRVVGGTASPEFEPDRWYRIQARRQDEHLTLAVDGKEVYSYRDPIPLPGGFVGLTGQGSHLRLRDLRVSTLGTSATVSCLSIPDTFFNRKLYEEAKAEYEIIAESLPGRAEGKLARFRSGLCVLELMREEQDHEVRELALDEAARAFAPSGESERSCLMALGGALVADEREDARGLHDSLAVALATVPDDPHLPIVHEWLLGRLHRLRLTRAPDRRRAGSTQRPALLHRLGAAARSGDRTQGSAILGDAVVHHRSQPFASCFRSPIPPVISTPSCSFRSGPAAVSSSPARFSVMTARRSRAHHLSDAYFALVELGHAEAARELLSEVLGQASTEQLDDRWGPVARCCRVADAALAGDLGEALDLLQADEIGAIDNTFRPFNSARLTLARAAWEASEPGVARRALHLRGRRDTFAREHLAWFAILDGDARRAESHLRPFVEKGHTSSGRNLSNFLYGCLQLLRGREDEAERTFRALPDVIWPRTWTLGSYFASGRLAGGDLERYLAESFPWERRALSSQREVLEAAGEA